MKLYCNLRVLMAKNNITKITALQGISGISRPTLYKMERNDRLETIKLESFIKICEALGCKFSELLTEIDD